MPRPPSSRHSKSSNRRPISSATRLCDEPGGPSYEFFEKVLPPLRYVDARYKHYPIVLAAPRSLVKGKVLSTGGIINPLARRYQWVGEAGIPWHVTLGPRHLPFGDDLTKLKGPHFADGYLPIVQLEYATRGRHVPRRMFRGDRSATRGRRGDFRAVRVSRRGSRANRSRNGKRHRTVARRRHSSVSFSMSRRKFELPTTTTSSGGLPVPA